MPVEAAPAVVPTPSTHPNAPAAAPVVATPPAAPVVDFEAKHKQLETDFQRKSREAISERRKAESLAKELAALKKRDEGARLNPIAHAKTLWGDDWHKNLNEMVANGGAPPAQLIQAEIQNLRDEIAQKEAERQVREDAELEAGRKSDAEKRVEGARRSIFADAAAFYRATGEEYPILAELGDPPAVARTIAQRIESEFHRTTELDDEGNVLKQGKVLTAAEAAGLIEEEVLKWAKAAGSHEKYKTKLQPPPTSATVAPSKQPQGQQSQQPQVRRSLTNQLTGSTSAVKPPVSAAERRERVLAAYEANRKKD